MDAFDADVLIYAAAIGHPLGRRVRNLFEAAEPDAASSPAGIGSVLLLPELLTKPLRDGAHDEVAALSVLLSRLHLHATDRATAELATALGAEYRLHATDAIHLATAVNNGADRFVTNNRDDFPKSIAELDIVYPDELAEATGGTG
jgi:predicted nucleic acid-binding protein